MSIAVQSKASFQFKNHPFNFTVIQLYSTDLALFAKQLKEKVQQAPRFFYQAPVVIDLQKLTTDPSPVNFNALSLVITQSQLHPIGIRGGSAEQQTAAQQAGFIVFTESRSHTKEERQVEASTQSPTRVITQPVRSGQQIYAKGGDLLILAPVSAGAELLADGHIHVYGPLRGRALAGVSGDPNTHIFCRNLEAELVSIAGHYRVSEDLKASLWRSPAHICLQGEELKIYHIE